MWSSDDFHKRHLGGGSGSGGDKARDRGAQVTLRPITGRTIHVGGNTDAARAFLFLDISCKRNRVAVDFQRQKFHERPGLKRKRLRSQSWRRKFRQAFLQTTERVQDLVKQGW